MKCQIILRVGDVQLIDEVPTEVLDSMSPYALRRAFGTLMEKNYKALRLNIEVKP